jgi:hypothetical protein
VGSNPTARSTFSWYHIRCSPETAGAEVRKKYIFDLHETLERTPDQRDAN